MAQLQQPNIVGNFLAAYSSGLERQQQQQDAAYQRQRQAKADQMTEQKFAFDMDAGQLDMALKRASAMNEILAGVDERNPQTLEVAKQRYMTSFGGRPEDVASITMADIPRIKMQTGQTLKELQIQAQKANIAQSYAAIRASNRQGQGGSGVMGQAVQRAALASQMGLDVNTPAGQRYILTGQLPAAMSATDKNAVQEADERVMSTASGLDMLRQARTLSDQSNSGFAANTMAQIPAWLGDESAQNTLLFDNLLQSQILPQLKSIFGGAITEGERQLLLDLQGSSSLPWKVRNQIIDRAIAMAERRMKFYQDQAGELRSGTYYNPRQQARPAPAVASAPPPAPAPRSTVPPPAARAATSPATGKTKRGVSYTVLGD